MDYFCYQKSLVSDYTSAMEATFVKHRDGFENIKQAMVFLEKTYGTDVEAVVAEIMVKFQEG